MRLLVVGGSDDGIAFALTQYSHVLTDVDRDAAQTTADLPDLG
jgi:hypothetical protein